MYRAYDPDLGRSIALKLLHLRKTSAERMKKNRARLMREAKVLALLSHRNVTAIYDVGEYGGDIFIAMEMKNAA